MRETTRALAELKPRCARLALDDSSRVFNTEVVAALELENMLEVAQTVAGSALLRNESRGAHTRTDYTTRDDQNFLHHSLCYFGADGPRLDESEVTLGRWEPEERKY